MSRASTARNINSGCDTSTDMLALRLVPRFAWSSRATKTRPAPRCSAALAASSAAPVMPGAPQAVGPVLIVAATYFAGRAHATAAANALILGVYGIGSVICHQLPERSFHLWSAQMPV